MDSSLKEELKKIIDLQSSVSLKPYAYLEQISYLIVLKLIDQDASCGDAEVSEGLVKDSEVFYGQADRYKWSNWIDMGPKMVDFLRDEVIPYMSSLESKDQVLNGIFNNADIKIGSNEVLLNLLTIISNIDFYKLSYEERVEFYDYLVNKLLKEKDYKLEQYGTPRNLCGLIVELLEPHPDDKILDPACGSGGFLTEYVDYFRRNYQGLEDNIDDNITGIDISRSMVRLTLVSLILRGIKNVRIFRDDFLKVGGRSEVTKSEKFDLILTHPPFQGFTHHPSLRNDLKIESKRTDVLYLDAIREQLKDDGYAAVVTANTFLESSMRGNEEIRKKLIEENELIAIIALPEGVFQPHTSVNSNILIFGKGQRRKNNKIWFYQLNNQGEINNKRATSTANLDFKDLLDKWNKYKETNFSNPPGPSSSELVKDEPTFWSTSKKEIKDNDYKLSFVLYKPSPKSRISIGDPFQILDNIEEIESDIQERLNELRKKINVEFGNE